LVSDERGLSTFEYSVLLVLLVLGSVLIWQGLGAQATCKMESARQQFVKALGGSAEAISYRCAQQAFAADLRAAEAAEPLASAQSGVVSRDSALLGHPSTTGQATGAIPVGAAQNRTAGPSNSSTSSAASLSSRVMAVFDRPVGTLGKAGALASGALVGAGIGAAGGWAAASAIALCGPGAAVCGGVLLGAAAYQGVQYLASGGLSELAGSFSRVFSSQSTSVGEAFQVGTTVGSAAYGLGAGGAFGSASAGRIQAVAHNGARAGDALRGRLVAAVSKPPGVTQRTVVGAICFAAGTPVHTADGLMPIEALVVGDMVWARDEHSRELALRAVSNLFVTREQTVLALELQDANGRSETLHVTPGHPLYSQERGWVAAQALARGEPVAGVSTANLRVISATPLDTPVTVYNIEVEGFHTYFVGAQAVWVHNECRAPRYTDDRARVFWSGGDVAKNAAARHAARTGRTTLEMTPRGKALEAADMPWAEAKPHWQNAAREFAEGARGRVDVFLARPPRSDSIWRTVEKPALERNPAVKKTRVHLPVVP
jgi:hypothetical protein